MVLVTWFLSMLSLAASVSVSAEKSCEIQTDVIKNMLTKTSECGEIMDNWGKKVDENLMKMTWEITKLVAILADTKEKQSEAARIAKYSLCNEAYSLELTLVGNKKYYFHHAGKMNWYNAKNFCEKHGMRLALPKTQSELDGLHTAASDRKPRDWWWVSASDSSSTDSGDFKWADGSYLSKADDLWHKANKDPDSYGSGTSACAEFSPKKVKKLEDAWCTDSEYFVCELPDVCL